jgi:biotin carboxyl carrier protein
MMEGASKSRARRNADDGIRAPANFAKWARSPQLASRAHEMKLQVRIGALSRRIEIHRTGRNQFVVTADEDGAHDNVPGKKIDAVEVSPNTYSILVNGRAFEAVVVPTAEGVLVRCGAYEFPALVSDPRAWRGGRGALFGAEGKQQVIAPMPGKVVRILVSAGQTVENDQGLLVVEAMKMQNEIRAPKAGKIERLLVREGQAVAAGEALVTID